VINDNRINPRAPIDLVVTVTLPDDKAIEVHSDNISLSGMMVVATHEQFQAILHRKTTLHNNAKSEPELNVSFTLTKHNKPLPIRTHCRAIHVRRISQDKFFIGLKFLQLSQAAAVTIQQYVTSNLD
jgi:c-di-GMP-binding flagellar brake protein YcgR